ncbi:MAG: serine/threonine protein kinase [Pirellulaceae bacterium]
MNDSPPSRSLVHSMTRVGRVVRTQLWIWPLLAAAVLLVAGWLINTSVENTMKRQFAGNLQTVLKADVEALRIWFGTQEALVHSAATEDSVAAEVGRMVEIAHQNADGASLLQSPTLKDIRRELRPWLSVDDVHADADEQKAVGHHNGFVVVDRQLRIVAADRDDLILLSLDPQARADLLDERAQALLRRALGGETYVTPPFSSRVVLKTAAGDSRVGVPTMFALSPVRDSAGEVVAVLGLRIEPEEEFTEILSIAQPGETGETYAFNDEAVLISQSRFDDQLKTAALLVDRDDVKSILNIELRDPQVDMTAGARPSLPRREQPLTRMAADALAGRSGVDVDGYRDYRGVPVIGAWTWIPTHGIGVATEIDVAEAYQPLYVLRWSFWILFSLLAVSAVVVYGVMLVARRLQIVAQKSALQAKRLGQYQLDEKIGEGGMGVVYRAHHALLQRPTAVKLLSPEKTNDASIARFEREVQLTSRLNHPNTIQIYDYGRTPEGTFYCAMEYLDGMSLEALSARFGPQCEGRVVHLLQQVCHSLAEAHSVGLIHRDIKPANIMLCRRGGLADFVKVLDFGLVKAVAEERQITLTAAGTITGTPLYLSPEGIESPETVDARSDLYAVGAVGYSLLTSGPVFLGKSLTEICMQQVNQAPEPPSQRLGRAVSPSLEALLLKCLAKKPEDRPQSADELLVELADCQTEPWGQPEARKWWEQHTERNYDTTRIEQTAVFDSRTQPG